MPVAAGGDGNTVSKGPDAFRTISEVAEVLDLPQHVLRFWETRFRQIKPMKRGGGRRYYRPEDVALLRGIRYLLYGEGYTIRGVQRILKEQGIQYVTGAFENQSASPEDGQSAPGSAEMAPVEAAPVNEPAEVIPQLASTNSSGGERLAGEDLNRLQSTLAELAELKRLLDQAR